MNMLHDNDRHDLEDGVRTMLHRLAAGVDESPPAWDDLVGRRHTREVPLGPSTSIPEVRNRPTRPTRPVRAARVSLAAASVALLAVAGAVMLGRDGSEPTAGPRTETISTVAPGEASFDAGAAAAVWATGLDDPVAATTAYLATIGVPTDVPAPPAVALRSATDDTAVVEWSLPGASGGGRGTVYLRSTSGTGTPPSWTVVGAATSEVALADVRYDGEDLSFSVARTGAAAGEIAIGVWVDGQPHSLGGDPVALPDAGDVSLGELLETAGDADAEGTLQLPVEADDIVTLRVVQVVDGAVRSLTQMAVALPEADPDLVADGAVAADGAAGGTVDATGSAGGGAAGSPGADVGAEAEASGGTELVPGLTVPTLPPLPLPAVPTLPGVTVPGVPSPALPTPPVTAPAPLTDALP